MNTKSILMSVLMIGVVAMAAGAGTLAYFSDTETSTGNTFTAGTIDIAVDGQNPWSKSYEVMLDGDKYLKPCQVGYIDFEIENVGTNPVDVWKRISNTVGDTGLERYDCGGTVGMRSSEPECVAISENCDIDDNNIEDWIWFDLTATVDGQVTQEILESEKLTLGDGMSALGALGTVENYHIYLGTIPAGGKMVVTQSFHLYQSTENIYQGDRVTFTETLTALQCEGAMPLPTGNQLPEHGR